MSVTSDGRGQVRQGKDLLVDLTLALMLSHELLITLKSTRLGLEDR